jgi:AcrR family transcriptional regulator
MQGGGACLSENVLTSDRIVDTAEDVLRRFGPTKTTIVDVARALGVSHGTIYRHYASKAELRDAVTARWLARITEPLSAIAEGRGSPTKRLETWITGLASIKQEKARQDPELYATYLALAEEAREVTQAHVEELVGQLAKIIEDGIAAGEFAKSNPLRTAKAVFAATIRFHHPAHHKKWAEGDTNRDLKDVLRILLAGLKAG